ncbi:MAG TPA: PQQ-binding-like beta-propeller repeat protein, partial [Verrucomicrobiae bacterium]|nr:PQQ-binding-like beta-propeller repeat protein [Verrucomicrobiae bacterium]
LISGGWFAKGRHMSPAGISALCGLLLATELFGQDAANWPVYGGNFAGTKYSALKQVTRENVRQLRTAWVYHCDDARGPGSTIECNPLIIEGRMYLTTAGIKLLALDAATGKELWRFDPWNGQGGRGVNRGVAFWRAGSEKRILFATGQFLHAIDAETGQLIPDFGVAGKVDLRDGLDRDVFFLSVTATSPGIIYKDLFIIGSVVGEGPNPGAPGHIRAYDVRTGKRKWIFHTIPHPGEFGYDTWSKESWKTAGGANSWGGLTLDVERGMVFAGTGSPSYDHFGGHRIGQNLFANCTLALKADTGERVWHFQAVHHDLWDFDLPCAPVLVQARHEGRVIDAVAQVGKIGHMFLFDRVTGKPLFPIEERAVPTSGIPGEQSWPTQPFPVKPPPYAQQRFTSAEVTDLSPQARDFALKQLKTMRTGNIFMPPGTNASVMLPQFNGGAEWGGPSFDPETRTLYVNASNEAEWISMVASTPRDEMTVSELGGMIYGTICSACHGFENANNPAAPSFATLKSVKDRLTKTQVAQLLETGRNQMPSFAGLSGVEKKSIVTFLFGERSEERISTREIKLSWADENPYVATGHHDFRDAEGYPVNKRPWGTLTAIDLDKGEFRWQVPLGTYRELEAKGVPPTGTFNIGGSLVTAGGLIFIGAAMDERFHAFDKTTGKLLWEFQMDAGGYATPATYSVKNKQFVVIAAGGGGKPGSKPGNAYYCFALP